MSIEIKLTFGTREEAIGFLSGTIRAEVANPSIGNAFRSPSKRPKSAQAETPVDTPPTVAPTSAVEPAPSPSKRPKSAQAETPVDIPPTVAPTPAAESAPSPASPLGADSAEEAEMPYAPLAARIVAAITVANPNAAANRVALKALFAELKAENGGTVAKGDQVQPADRPRLAALLDTLEGSV